MLCRTLVEVGHSHQIWLPDACYTHSTRMERGLLMRISDTRSESDKIEKVQKSLTR